MHESRHSPNALFALIVLAFALAGTPAAMAADDNAPQPLTQPAPVSAPAPVTPDQTVTPAPVQSQAPVQPVPNEAPAKAKKSPAVHRDTHKHKAAAHHRKARKKPAPKTARAHHKKPAKKAPPPHRHKQAKKTVHPRVKETHRVVPKPARPAADSAKAAIPVEKMARAPAKVAETNVAGKSVAYNFCLGYDNCVPHRYETTPQGHKILEQDSKGAWTEAKIDPVMEADLGKMAQSEPASHVERALTTEEKARIADHQGKMHGDLVGDVASGSGNMERVKADMRELRINNLNDLEAYDPKLAHNDVAVEAVNQLSGVHK